MTTLSEQPSVSPPLPRAKWPKVLGVISIVLGAIGVLNLPMGAIQKPMMKLSMQSYVDGGMATEAEVDRFLGEWGNYQLVTGLAFGLIGIPILVGGILLLKQKKLGVLLLQVWAVLLLLYLVFSAATSPAMFADLIAVMGGDDTDMQEVIALIDTAGRIGIVVVSAIIAVVPIFYLIWLNRASVRALVSAWD